MSRENGVAPMDTAAVCSEIQKSCNRDDVAQWAEAYAALFPSYQLLMTERGPTPEVRVTVTLQPKQPTGGRTLEFRLPQAGALQGAAVARSLGLSLGVLALGVMLTIRRSHGECTT